MPSTDFVARGLTVETSRELQLLAFRYGYCWYYGQKLYESPHKSIIVYSSSLVINHSADDTTYDVNRTTVYSNHCAEFIKWITDGKGEQPQPTTKEKTKDMPSVGGLWIDEDKIEDKYNTTGVAFLGVDKDTFFKLQDLAVFYGWNGGCQYSNDTICFKANGRKEVLHASLEYETANPEPLQIRENYLEEAERWLRRQTGKDTKPKEQHKDEPQTRNMNDPYELMCKDLVDRVLAQVKEKIPSAGELRAELSDSLESVKKEIEDTLKAKLDTLQASRLIIEDRRSTPPTITELPDAVHASVPEVIGIVQSGCWCAAVGPSGGGKTLGAFQCADALKIPRQLVCIKQMTRIIAPHDLIGFMDAGGHYRKGAWTDAILGQVYDNSNGGKIPTTHFSTPAMIIVDEMDNANENVIMILKALNTGRIMMPYGMQEVNPQVVVIATMNTWGTGATREYVGRCAQDAALLNEFQFQEWNYDEAFEWALLQRLYMSYKDAGGWKLEHMRTLLDMFSAMRVNAEKQNIRIIISTRNIINVAKMLICNQKWSVNKCLQKSVYKGLKKEEVDRVKAPHVWKKHKDVGNQEPSHDSEDTGLVISEGSKLKEIGECPI